MKNAIAILVLALAAGVVSAQTTYTTGDAPVNPGDNSDTLDVCQSITVPATGGTITNATVEVTAAHTWIGDLAFEVTSPSATQLMILNKPGTNSGGNGNSDDLVSTTPITYDDAAVSGISAEDMGDVCVGIIDGSVGCEDNYIPAPDSGTPFIAHGTNLADFDGENPTGLWTLCVGDSAAGDTGTLLTWSLTITQTPVELQTFAVE
jgi:subtilisin-like proprotein convertase family protein